MERKDFITNQANSFITYLDKKGSQTFDKWADSKDFMKEDRNAIKQALTDMLSEGRTEQRQGLHLLQPATRYDDSLTLDNFLIRFVNKRIFTDKEAAVYLGIGVTKFRLYAKEGRFPNIRFPNNVSRRYDVFDLDSWVEKLKTNGQR